MDGDGRRAARGRVLHDVLARWLAHPFVRRRPPKTTGRESFGRPFLERELNRLRSSSPRADDWIATTAAFTARSIILNSRWFLPGFAPPGPRGRYREAERIGRGRATEVIVCGGGAGNATLMAMLAAGLPGARVSQIDSFGIPRQAKEAVSFAVLAAARADGTAANVPAATGAARPALLGRMVES